MHNCKGITPGVGALPHNSVECGFFRRTLSSPYFTPTGEEWVWSHLSAPPAVELPTTVCQASTMPAGNVFFLHTGLIPVSHAGGNIIAHFHGDLGCPTPGNHLIS